MVYLAFRLPQSSRTRRALSIECTLNTVDPLVVQSTFATPQSYNGSEHHASDLRSQTRPEPAPHARDELSEPWQNLVYPLAPTDRNR